MNPERDNVWFNVATELGAPYDIAYRVLENLEYQASDKRLQHDDAVDIWAQSKALLSLLKSDQAAKIKATAIMQCTVVMWQTLEGKMIDHQNTISEKVEAATKSKMPSLSSNKGQSKLSKEVSLELQNLIRSVLIVKDGTTSSVPDMQLADLQIDALIKEVFVPWIENIQRAAGRQFEP